MVKHTCRYIYTLESACALRAHLILLLAVQDYHFIASYECVCVCASDGFGCIVKTHGWAASAFVYVFVYDFSKHTSALGHEHTMQVSLNQRWGSAPPCKVPRMKQLRKRCMQKHRNRKTACAKFAAKIHTTSSKQLTTKSPKRNQPAPCSCKYCCYMNMQ